MSRACSGTRFLEKSDAAVGSDGIGWGAILPIAFFVNLIGMLNANLSTHQAMNVTGAAISRYASYLIGFASFVVLEPVWCAPASGGDVA